MCPQAGGTWYENSLLVMKGNIRSRDHLVSSRDQRVDSDDSLNVLMNGWVRPSDGIDYWLIPDSLFIFLSLSISLYFCLSVSIVLCFFSIFPDYLRLSLYLFISLYLSVTLPLSLSLFLSFILCLSPSFPLYPSIPFSGSHLFYIFFSPFPFF